MQRSQLISIIVAGIGFVIIVLAAVLGWIVVPNIIDDKIIEQVRLVNGSETWDKWQEIPIPVYLKFVILHVTNPDGVENGETPKIEEKGPYTYREQRVKVNISQESGDDLLKYEQITIYFYDEEQSCRTCKEDDKFNIINIAFISVLSGIAEIDPGLAALIANSVLGSETVIQRNVRVGDLTFLGFDVRLYTETLGPLLPEEFSGGRFGLYKGKNESADGVYEIYTGVDRTADFGKIKTWDGKTSVDDWWRPGSPCAMINGTDGSVFPPFVEKSRVLDIFTTDLCRSIVLKYEKEIEHRGIKGYRFVAPKDMLEDPRVNVANQCFCMKDDIEDCPKAGVLPVATCRSGAPIMMSTPHFLDGTPSYYVDAGQTAPVKELHETYVDLEPHTGVALRASKKIQVNVELKKFKGVKAMANIKDYTIFPLLWADEEANLDEVNADDVKKQLLTPLKIVLITKWTLLAVGCVLFGVGAAMFIIYYRRSTRTV